MFFLLQRPLEDSIVIEAETLDEFRTKVLNYKTFHRDATRKVFEGKNWTQEFGLDGLSRVMKMTQKEIQTVWTKLCSVCVEEAQTYDGIYNPSYIPDDHTMCDRHLLDKHGLYEHMTYDSMDYLGLDEFIRADKVIEALRKLEGGKSE